MFKDERFSLKMHLINKTKNFLLILLLVTTISGCSKEEISTDKVQKVDLVEVVKLDSTILFDIHYATTNNFMEEKLYPVARCFLRREVAERLSHIQKALREEGLGLKIWDGYRPLSVQWKMWEKVSDPKYVADPRKGSRHNRGCAVDVTLVDAAGNELEMPTGYDDFTEKAHRNYMQLPPEVIKNRQILETAMTREGFIPLPSEWWHFDDPNWEKYNLLDIPLEKVN
ncbi:MAG: M15 family metallopeptidase [bacterium]